MARQNFELGDYVDVPTRIAEFRAKHPEGSLQPADTSKPFEIVTIGADTFIAVVAAAYRTPDDDRPGIGMAYEVYPGRTPYTRGSELQNAETSAWGRAIVAALAADTKRGIASAEEVRNRQAERDDQWDSAAPARPAQRTARSVELYKAVTEAQTVADLQTVWQEVTAASTAQLITPAEGNQLASHVKTRKAELEAADRGELVEAAL